MMETLAQEGSGTHEGDYHLGTMLPSGAGQAGIDGPTMSAEDAHSANAIQNGSMDVRRMIAFIGAFYWIMMTVFVVPGAVIATFLTLMLPALMISVPLHNWIDHKMCRFVNDHWASAAQSAGLNVIEYGDDINKIANKRVLFLSNHLGLADHFVLMCALYNKGTIAEKYLWVIYNIWKATPLGAMWLTHGNFFINGGAANRDRVLGDFKEHLRKYFWANDHQWIVMYPEGSRLYLVKESNARYATKLGMKPFRHCALPRSGAAHSVLQIAGPQKEDDDKDGTELVGEPIDYVVDCTLGYYKGVVPDLGQLVMGDFSNGSSTVGVHYKIYPTKPEWSDEGALKQWLYELYEEKDDLLEDYYKNGKFPTDAKCRARPLHFPLSRCIVVETFWTVLLYAHYSLWIRPACVLLWSYTSSMFV